MNNLKQVVLDESSDIHTPIGNYNFVEFLGKGQFGSVYKVETMDTGEVFAIKEVSKKSLSGNKKLAELFQTEIKVMKEMNHINILKCYETLEDEKSWYLVLEICNNGDLEEFINNTENKRLEEKQAVYF